MFGIYNCKRKQNNNQNTKQHKNKHKTKQHKHNIKQNTKQQNKTQNKMKNFFKLSRKTAQDRTNEACPFDWLTNRWQIPPAAGTHGHFKAVISVL